MAPRPQSGPCPLFDVWYLSSKTKTLIQFLHEVSCLALNRSSRDCSRDLCGYFDCNVVANPASVFVAGISGDVGGRASAAVRQPQPAAAVPSRLRRLTAEREPDRRLPSRSRSGGISGQHVSFVMSLLVSVNCPLNVGVIGMLCRRVCVGMWKRAGIIWLFPQKKER